MNEKFLSRGKREDTKIWVEGYYFEHNGDYAIVDLNNRYNGVIPETVGRYTGKNDKKGRNVFEGDIVRVKKFNDDPIIGKVVFNENTAGFEVWWDIVVGAYGEKATRKENFAVCGQMEVIGNIHDNSELIGGTE